MKSKSGRKIKKKHVKLIFPSITIYWARHSWASIAAELDIPKETISLAFEHGAKTVTDRHINFNMKKVDEANRKVIDYFFEK